MAAPERVTGTIKQTTLNGCVFVQDKSRNHTRVIDLRNETFMLVGRQTSRPVQDLGSEDVEDDVSLSDICVDEGISLDALESRLNSGAEDLDWQEA